MKYLKRFKECLINPTYEQSVERDPLQVFSFYLSSRENILCTFAEEIIEHLDHGFAAECIDVRRIERAESLMWLWILGAYEIVRTMYQAKQCFSAQLQQDLHGLKKTLAHVRMPAAKMEKPGQNLPVSSNRSPSGWDVESRDLLVGDPDASANVSARWLLAEFDKVFCSITPTDILAHHETSYPDGPNNSFKRTPNGAT